MLEVKRLRLLWELSHRGTVAAVAEALNYSPSAVSQQLQQLENEIGAPLLRKAGRRIELTSAAAALAAETETLLAGLERAESAFHRANGEVSGTARIAVFQSALLALMPQTLERLRAEFPALRVEVVQYEPETGLRETWGRSFDLVVAERYPHHDTVHFPGLDRALLTSDSLQLALPPRGNTSASCAAVTELRDTATLPWVVEPHGAASRHFAEQLCRAAGFEPDIRFETADLQAQLRLIESGNAVAILPGLIHAHSPAEVRLLPLAGNPRREIFTAARESSATLPAVRAVREILQEVAAAIPVPESPESPELPRTPAQRDA